MAADILSWGFRILFIGSGMKQQMIAETSIHTSWPAGPVASVPLPADCRIRALAGLRSCLRRMPEWAAFDGFAVQRIDRAGIQLLLAFIRERRAARVVVTWSGVSPRRKFA